MKRRNTRTAVLLARFSPRPGAATCDSCIVQLHDMRSWCEQNGYKVRSEHQDDAMSGIGQDDERTGLQGALESLKRGDTLLVRDLDRLSRDPHARMGYMLDLTRRGVRVVSLIEGEYKPEDKESKLLFGILAVMGEYRRDCIAESTRTKMRQHQANGRSMSGIAPYGYRLSGKRLVTVVEEQAVIAEIVKLHAAQMPLRQIAETLNARGVPSRGNTFKPGGAQRWSHHAITRILNREQNKA